MNARTPIAITLMILFLAANLGVIYTFRGHFSGDPPTARNPKFAEEAGRGLDAFRRADYDRAIASFDELIRLDPNHSEAHRWRGDTWLNKRELDRALSEYDEAIRLDPRNGMAYCGRGAAWTAKGEFDRAIASFDEAIRLDPQIANMPFYKRYRAAAEVRGSLGLSVVIPLLALGLWLFLAFAAWTTLRHRKPKPDKDL
jgi:tetratricopeptide (TPR) repeat protein